MVYALYLYALWVTNPLAVLIAAQTVFSSLDFYWNGQLSWWDRWGKILILGIIGIAATVVACIVSGPCGGAAKAASIWATLGQIALGTVIGTTIALAIGGLIAGFQSANTGHGFWEGFANHIQDNFLEALVTSFAFAAVSRKRLIRTRF